MVFVNRHLKVPKWFKEWYDKLDPPKELSDKVLWGNIPYAIAKVLNVDGWGTNIWDPIDSPNNYLYRNDWHPKNMDIEKINQCTIRNKLYLIEALVDKSLATDKVSEESLELSFDINRDIEKVLLAGGCYQNIMSITDLAVFGHSMEVTYDVPRELRDGFVHEIQKNYLPYVIYLLDQNKEDSPKWK